MKDDRLSNFVNRPLRIGEKTISGRLVFAPMTVVGNIAFRELLAQFGGFGLLFSEMCDASRIPHENRKVSPYFRWRDREREHLVFQISGSSPSIMAEAAKRLENEGFFGVDINFGCSMARICKKNQGAALLKDPSLAGKIVSSVRKAVTMPLFVKFRTGWKDNPDMAVSLARRFEDCGADSLTFHPRVSPDRRSRPPRWEYIGLVKNAVSIPVFGNGNVFTFRDCLKMFRATHCDGICVGRMAVARPWLFSQWANGFEPDERCAVESALRLVELLEKHFDSTLAVRRFKKFAQYFSANFLFGNVLYNLLKNAPDLARAREELGNFFETSHPLLPRPNMNFFV